MSEVLSSIYKSHWSPIFFYDVLPDILMSKKIPEANQWAKNWIC